MAAQTKEEIFAQFRDQLARTCTAPEAKAVKDQLAFFLQTKVVDIEIYSHEQHLIWALQDVNGLIAALKPIINNAARTVLFPTISLLIPGKYQDEFQRQYIPVRGKW